MIRRSKSKSAGMSFGTCMLGLASAALSRLGRLLGGPASSLVRGAAAQYMIAAVLAAFGLW
jgi:hypothetical protein